MFRAAKAVRHPPQLILACRLLKLYIAFVCSAFDAGVVELVDTRDLKGDSDDSASD
jgi:hypothetical protein